MIPKKPADTIIDLYQQNANEWINLRRCDVFERGWLDRFIAMLGPNGRDVLDLGCGSGRPIAGYLIDNRCQVTGVDAATSLLDIAADTFPEQTWIAADMRRLPPLGKFNGLIAWHSFFHLTPDDQRLMFETFNRLAHAGAPLMFPVAPAWARQLVHLQVSRFIMAAWTLPSIVSFCRLRALVWLITSKTIRRAAGPISGLPERFRTRTVGSLPSATDTS